jgi:hypothetical protein
MTIRHFYTKPDGGVQIGWVLTTEVDFSRTRLQLCFEPNHTLNYTCSLFKLLILLANTVVILLPLCQIYLRLKIDGGLW